MKSQQEILEERLKQQRSAPDRSDRLNDMVSANRASRASQDERAERSEKNVEAGTNHVFWEWAQEHEEAAGLFGDVVGMDMMKLEKVEPAIAFATGIVSLDLALGGGIPNGVTEVYGKESVGKTTLLVDLIQSAQGQGIECALLCSEYFDAQRYEYVGVDMDALVLIKGGSEDSLVLGSTFVLDGDHRALFIDSATAIRPIDDQYNQWMKMWLAWLSIVTPKIAPRSCVVMTNQVRTKKSVKPHKTFAGGTDSAAQKILGCFNTRLELQKVDVHELTYDMVINVVANVLSAPAKLVTLPTHKKNGIDVWKDLVRVAGSVGALDTNGNWYRFGGQSIGQGEEATARYLEKNPDVGSTVFEKTLGALRS